MSVYILHLTPKFKHARHYIGFSERVKKRFAHHLNGTGSKFTQACRLNGITMILARVYPGADRAFERNLKKQSRSRIPEKCPVCCCITIAEVMLIRKIKLP